MQFLLPEHHIVATAIVEVLLLLCWLLQYRVVPAKDGMRIQHAELRARLLFVFCVLVLASSSASQVRKELSIL